MAKKKAAKKCGPKLIQKLTAHCKKRTDVIQMLKNEAGRWYWRGLSTENNKITDTSGEDYSTFGACREEAVAHAMQLGVPLELWE